MEGSMCHVARVMFKGGQPGEPVKFGRPFFNQALISAMSLQVQPSYFHS